MSATVTRIPAPSVRCRVMRSVVGLLAFGLALLAHCVQGAETVTVLTAHETAAEQTVRDLLQVELSTDAEIEIVERTNVRDLLQEQRISAFGDQSDSLLLGRLLGVDAFVVWEGARVDDNLTTNSGRLICFDGATGTRLGDHSLAGDDVFHLARDAARAIRDALKKRTALKNAEIALFSITSIRNVDLPAGETHRVPQLIAQVEQALIAQPGVALLERERLRFVLREQQLPLATAQAHLLAATQSITLEFSRTADNAVQVTLRIHHPLDEKPIELDWLPGDDAGLIKLSEKLSRVLATEGPRWREAASSGPSSVAQEAQRLESDARRLDAIQNPFGAAVRWEASYLLDKHDRRLSMLLTSLQGSLARSMIDPITHTNSLYPMIHELNGMRRTKPAAAPPAPEEMWLRAIEIADYHLMLADELGHHAAHPQSPYNELISRSFFHWNLAYLNSHDHPQAILKARSYLERFEALLLKRNATDQPDPKAKLTDSERRASAASLRFRLFCGAKRYLYTDWESKFLELARDLDAADHRIPPLIEVTEALIDLSPASRQKFFDTLGSSSGRQMDQLPLHYRYLQLWVDAHHGRPELQQSLDDRVGQFVSDVTEQICDPNSPERQIRFGYGIVVSGGPITIPAGFGHGLSLISDALELPGVRSQSQRRIAVFRELVKHNFVDAELIDRQLQPQNPEHRQLLEQALQVMESDGSGYKEEDRARLIAAIRTRLSGAPKITSLERRLTLIYPPPGRPVADTRIIHALPTPSETLLFTRRLDRQRAAWIVEASVIEPGSPPKLRGTYAFPQKIVTEFEAKLPTLGFQGNRPLNFFELSISTALPVADEKHFFLPTPGGGILVFPRNGNAAYVIDEAAGLPSNCIQALAVVQGTLYAWVGLQGVGGNNMVAIDIASKRVRTLVSTEQEEKTTPLNSLPGGQCLGLVKSPTDDALYLLISAYTDKRNGLWMMDCQTSRFRSVYTSDYFISDWFMLDGDQVVFGKRGLHFGKPGFKGGAQPSDRFSDVVTVNCSTNQWEEVPIPKLVEDRFLPLWKNEEYTFWFFPPSHQFTIEKRSTGNLIPCQFFNRRSDEHLKWTHLLDNQETLLLYSTQRVWTAQLNDLLPSENSLPE